jgi:hypothetical protein
MERNFYWFNNHKEYNLKCLFFLTFNKPNRLVLREVQEVLTKIKPKQ